MDEDLFEEVNTSDIDSYGEVVEYLNEHGLFQERYEE